MNLAQLFDSSLTARQPVAARLFESALTRERIAHAYLFCGGEPGDKELMSLQLAMYLNCHKVQPDDSRSCHVRGKIEDGCQNCRWIGEKKHPQVWFELTGGESASGKVSVELSRQLAFELSKTSTHKRVVYVPDASEGILHRPAANALLKTIEEPRGECYFLFVAPAKESVLATIVSRCQIIPFQADGTSATGPIQRVQKHAETDLLKAAGESELELVSSLRSLKQLDFFKTLVRSQEKVRTGASGNHSNHAVSVSNALKLAQRLEELISDGIDYVRVIDSACLIEIEIIGRSIPNDPQVSYYVQRLLERAEEAKLQLGRYVSKKAALDCFALDWNRSREQLSG